MPEMTFSVRWPDNRVEDCYSPSLVVHDHLEVGGSYPVHEFVSRASAALRSASERVRARYGFACSASDASRARIEHAASRFASDATVEVVAMAPALPGRPA